MHLKTLAVAGLMLLASHAAFAQRPCEQIRRACKDAGFVQGGVPTGNGLTVDCIAPIMQGKPQRRKAKQPLPNVDPETVAACKAANPNFGQPKGASSEGQASLAEQPAASVPLMVPSGPPANNEKHPNIVFILTDDLALNLVQFMPHVLQMQKEGATFTNYFVTDSLCCPSRSSIFTGRYPHTTGVFKNQGPDGGYQAFIDHGNEQASFATEFSASGYRIAMMGKYLNGYRPEQNSSAPGWTEWDVAGNGYPEFNYSLNQNGKLNRYGRSPDDYLTDVLSKLAQDFIKNSNGQAFMLEVATFAPHAPYTPAPRDANAFPDLKAPRTSAYDAAPDADAPRWLRTHPALTPADKARIDEDFRKRAQSVLAVDRMIGEIEKVLEKLGQAKNTYLVFSSDNGYHMGEHRLMPGKMTAFDTDIHVPLVITGPGIPAGLTLDEMVENVDLNPTFTELAAIPIMSSAEGRSLVSLMKATQAKEHDASDWRTAVLIEHHGPRREPADPDMPAPRSGNPPSYEALRTATAVYVEYVDGDREYHDRTTDPWELKNTYDSLSGEQKSALHAALAAMQSCNSAESCWIAQHVQLKAPTLH